MNPKKQNRRKANPNKLEPIDWREFANDAVLNGNMSTLYRRPPSEDPSAYASPEAMVEIEKRVNRSNHDAEGAENGPHDSGASSQPTVGLNETVGSTPPEIPSSDQDTDAPATGSQPTVGSIPTVGAIPAAVISPTAYPEPTVGSEPPMGFADLSQSASLPQDSNRGHTAPTALAQPTVGILPPAGFKPTDPLVPTVGAVPTVGRKNKKIRAIRTVHDALTLAGQVLYGAMAGTPDTRTTSCTKGYRQLAAETHLDKDTVRDLIVEFKQKGILRETATYDPDTRLSKTYEVLSNHAVLQAWRESGIFYVTTGRQRPLFCSADGERIIFTPTVGSIPRPA